MAIGAASLIWRWLYLWEVVKQDLVIGLSLDSEFYARVAQAIRSGHGAGPQPYLLSPLYPYFLSLFPGIEGPPGAITGLAVQAWQAVFDSATCVLVAMIGNRIGGRRVGILSGAIGASYAPLVHSVSLVVVACLEGFFITLALAMVAELNGPQGWRTFTLRWVGTGLALGAAAALWPIALAVAAGMGTLLALCGMTLEARRARASAALLGLVIGVAAIVAPLTVRNVLVSGEFVLLSANGGVNFWLGNNATATGAYPTKNEDSFGRDDPLGISQVERALGHPVGYRAASRWWLSRALADIKEAPGRWLGLLLRKMALFMSPVEIPQLGSDFAWMKERTWALGVPLDARVLLILAFVCPLVQLALHGRVGLSRIQWPLVALLTYGAAVCLFFVTGRFRIPIMPATIVLASAALCGLWDLLRSRALRRRYATLGLMMLLSLCAGASHVLYKKGGPYHIITSRSFEEYRIGLLYLNRGRPHDAIALLDAALAEREDPKVRSGLAQALKAVGRIDEAIQQFEIVLRVAPGDAVNIYNYANLLWRQRGERERAERLYRSATELAPRFAEAHNNLGAVLFELRRFPDAAEAFRNALRLAPRNAPWRQETETLLLESEAITEGLRTQ